MSRPVYDIPDLQGRISKKVAQLTKVIYHLHEKKNDDEAVDMLGMADAYEVDIEHLLRDAASKINSFKGQLEVVRDETLFQEAVAKVQLRYEQERQACLSDFENFKQRMADREGAMQRAATKQVAAATSSCDQLQERLKEAQITMQSLKQQATAADKNLQSQLDKARAETEEAIQAGNHRYNAMLTERMNTEDKLSQQIEALKLELASKERSLSHLSKQIELAAQERKDAEALQARNFESERAAFRSQIDKADGVWRDKLATAMKQLQQEQGRANDAQRQAFEAEANAEDTAVALKSAQSALQAAEQQCTQTQASLDSTSAKLAQEAEQCSTLDAQVESLRRQLAGLQEAASGDKSALQDALVTERQQQAALKEALLSEQRGHEQARAELKSVSAELRQCEQDLAAVTAAVEQARLEREQQRTAAVADKAESTRRLAEVRAAAEAAAEAAAKERARLQRQLAEAIEAGRANASDAEQRLRLQMEQQLHEAAEDHAAKVAALQAEFDKSMQRAAADAAAELSATKVTLTKEADEMAASKDAAMAAALEAARAEKCEAQAAWDGQRDRLNDEISSLTGQLAAQQRQAVELRSGRDELLQQLAEQGQSSSASEQELQAQITGLQTQLSAAQNESASLQAQLHKLKDDYASLQESTSKASREAAAQEAALRDGNQSLRLTLEHTKQEAAENLRRQLNELEAEWKVRMEEKLTEALLTAGKDHQTRLKQELAQLEQSLQSRFDASIQELKSKHESDIASMRASDSGRVSSLQKEHEQKLAALAETHQQALQEVHLCAQREQAAAVAREEARAEEQCAQLAAEASERMSEAESCHRQREAELKAEKEAALQNLAAERDAVEAELRREMASSSKQLQSALEAEKARSATLDRKLREELQTAQKRIEELVSQSDGLKSAVSKFEQQVGQLQEALANKSAELSDTLFQVRRDQGDEVSALKDRHQQELELARGEAASRIRQMQDDMEASEQGAAVAYDTLMRTYDELKDAWERRGPRDEDVRQIQELQAMVHERDVRLLTVEERLSELKKEMLLREDNYNNHFANGGAGRKMLKVDQAASSGQEVTDWMLKKKVSRQNSQKNGSGRITATLP